MMMRKVLNCWTMMMKMISMVKVDVEVDNEEMDEEDEEKDGDDEEEEGG